MESMNISLPEGLRDFVHEQVASGYGSVSEYIRELIRADQTKKEYYAHERQLLEDLTKLKGRGLSKSEFFQMRKILLNRNGLSDS